MKNGFERTPLQTESLTIRLPGRLAAMLDDAARIEDRSRSEYVRELLRRELCPKGAERSV